MASTLLAEFDEQLFIKQYHLHFLDQKRKSIGKVVGAVSPSRPPLQVNQTKVGRKPEGEKFENLLVSFFNISYFLGIVPHYFSVVDTKTQRDSISGQRCNRKVNISASKPHTVLVILVHVCAILRLLLRFSFLSYNLKNPLNHFRIARTILSAALCCFFLWSLWMRHQTCRNVLHRLANLQHFPNITFLRKTSVQYALLFVMISLICITCINRAIVDTGRRWTFFCEGNDDFNQWSFCHDEMYRMEHYLAKTVYTIVSYFGRVTKQFPRMDLLIVAITLWQTCKSFGKYVEIESEIDVASSLKTTKMILEVYEELKEISNLLCELVGEMVICEIVEDILYFSLEVQLRLREADWFSVLIISETFLMAFLAKFVAACATQHVQQFGKWLAKDAVLSKLSPGKVITLHQQLATNPIGMKGGSLFTLTKGFLANVVTVWLTYFIILLQFEIEFE